MHGVRLVVALQTLPSHRCARIECFVFASFELRRRNLILKRISLMEALEYGMNRLTADYNAEKHSENEVPYCHDHNDASDGQILRPNGPRKGIRNWY